MHYIDDDNRLPLIKTEIRSNSIAVNYTEARGKTKRILYIDIYNGLDTVIGADSKQYPRKTIRRALSTIIKELENGELTEELIENIKTDMEKDKYFQ